jgi:hypothetical protein
MNVRIAHEDGRAYEVPEDAFTALYEPEGFTITGLVYNGGILSDTEENRALAANPVDPNFSDAAKADMTRAEVGYVNPANVEQGLVNEDGSPVLPDDAVVNAPDDTTNAEVVTSTPGATVPVNSVGSTATPKVATGMINPADQAD